MEWVFNEQLHYPGNDRDLKMTIIYLISPTVSISSPCFLGLWNDPPLSELWDLEADVGEVPRDGRAGRLFCLTDILFDFLWGCWPAPGTVRQSMLVSWSWLTSHLLLSRDRVSWSMKSLGNYQNQVSYADGLHVSAAVSPGWVRDTLTFPLDSDQWRVWLGVRWAR